MTSKTLQFMNLVAEYGSIKHVQGQCDADPKVGGLGSTQRQRLDQVYDKIEAEVTELHAQLATMERRQCQLVSERDEAEGEVTDLRALLRDVYDTWVFGDLSVSLMARVKTEGLK